MTPTEEIALGEALAEALYKLYGVYKSAKAGQTSPDAALAQIKTMTDGLAANNAAADAELAQRFPAP